MIYRVEYTDKQLKLSFKHYMAVNNTDELVERIKNNYPSDRYDIDGYVLINN